MTVVSDLNLLRTFQISQREMVGVFGGTFDPIHFGHLKTVSAVQIQLSLARILLIPTYIPPHRLTPTTEPEHRIAMIQSAIKSMPRLVCDDREIQRGGISYTLLTVQELRQEFGETPLFLILGLDSFLDLPRWHRWSEILDHVHIIVMKRPGWVLPSSLPDWWQDAAEENLGNLQEKSYGHVYCMSVPSINITSTGIRHQLSRDAHVNDALPSSVLSYIRRHQLYGNQ